MGSERPPASLAPRVRPTKSQRACEAGAWHIRTWKFNPKTGEILTDAKHSPYKCHSWRHAGECRRWRAAQNFARVSAALAPKRPRDVLFMVLTLNPGEWKSRYQAFRQLTLKWSALRKAITRHFGDNDWVGTVEVHRSGWPHLNVIMWSPAFADFARTKGKRRPDRVLPNGKRQQMGIGGAPLEWLKRHAVECGFGYVATMDVAKSKGAVAGYVVKVAGEIDHAAHQTADGRMVGEVVKFSQVPENAPRHFRRLRASIRFLPKPFKNPEVTGELVRSPAPPKAERKASQR